MLYHFFTEGMPVYDDTSFDRPNDYNKNIEYLPDLHLNVTFKETLVCFIPSLSSQDKLTRVIACQAYLEYEFKRERIKKVKHQIWNKIKEATINNELSKNV